MHWFPSFKLPQNQVTEILIQEPKIVYYIPSVALSHLIYLKSLSVDLFGYRGEILPETREGFWNELRKLRLEFEYQRGAPIFKMAGMEKLSFRRH